MLLVVCCSELVLTTFIITRFYIWKYIVISIAATVNESFTLSTGNIPEVSFKISFTWSSLRLQSAHDYIIIQKFYNCMQAVKQKHGILKRSYSEMFSYQARNQTFLEGVLNLAWSHTYEKASQNRYIKLKLKLSAS